MEKTSSLPESSAEEVRKHLYELAVQRGPGAQMPSVREMCTRFSTTRVTLRLALKSLFAENVLYSKEREGVFVSPKLHYKSIAILFDASIFALPLLSPFWSSLLVLLSQESQKRATFKREFTRLHHVFPIPDQNHSLPEDVIQNILSARIHGVLAIGLSSSSQEWLSRQSVPCVTFAGHGPWMVELDFGALGRVGAHSLIEQGCQKIGIWQYTTQRYEEDVEDMDLFQGFKQAHLELHKSFYRNLARIPRLPSALLFPNQAVSFQEQGYLLAKEIYGTAEGEKPDGLIIGDEMVTHGALIAFQEMGIRVGTDVKIATHRNVNSPILFGLTRNITVFEFDPQELVQTMFAVLDMLMVGQEPATRHVQLAPHLGH